MTAESNESLVLGGGCFWCIEAVYERLPGVKSVTSGYAGGKTPQPTYEQVCTGTTGHAEVVKIDFDPSQINVRQLIDFFWDVHDPTTLNRQGADVGTQYRSIILFANEQQKQVAQESLKAAQQKFSKPIVTEIKPLEAFYPAEEKHQDFYRRNPLHPYNQAVIAPKIRKIQQAKSD